jgi:hypothetical protein
MVKERFIRKPPFEMNLRYVKMETRPSVVRHSASGAKINPRVSAQ